MLMMGDNDVAACSAESSSSTSGIHFTVTNNTFGQLGTRQIIVFITSAVSQNYYSYAAWHHFYPGDGASADFEFNSTVSVTATNDAYVSNSRTISPGYASDITSTDGQSPVIGTPSLAPDTVSSVQEGVINRTVFQVYPVWSVAGSKAMVGTNTLTNGGTSVFQLQPTLYWTVVEYTEGQHYTYGQVSQMTPYSVPESVSNIKVSVTYDVWANRFVFTFSH